MKLSIEHSEIYNYGFNVKLSLSAIGGFSLVLKISSSRLYL